MMKTSLVASGLLINRRMALMALRHWIGVFLFAVGVDLFMLWDCQINDARILCIRSMPCNKIR